MNLNISNKSNLKEKYRTDIDGLRAIAVLLVVGFHVSPNWIKNGFVGVDIFFVISGYLISSNIVGNLANKNFNFIDFYSRRARRIFPALGVVLVFCLCVGWFYLLGPEYQQLGKHVAGGASFIENILYLNESGYFDTQAYTKPLLNLWSLGVEEQFYIFWPFYLWLLCKLELNIFAGVLIVSILSFYLNLHYSNENQILAYYSPQTRFWEMGVGALLGIFYISRSSSFKNKKENIRLILYFKKYILKIESNTFLLDSISILGMLLILIALLVINDQSKFPGWWATIPVAGSILILFAGRDAFFNKKILSNKVLVWIGLISFPLYLWHWVLLSFTKIINLEGFGRETRAVVVLISFLLAWITYKIIEQPIRYGHYLKRKTISLYVLMLVIFTSGLFIQIYKGLPGRSFAKNFNIYVAAFNDWNWNEGLVLSVTRSGITYFSNVKESPKIAFIGDSHIQQFGPRIKKLTQDKNFTAAAFLTMPGCPPIPGVYDDKHPQCREFISEIDNFLAENPNLETLILSACWNCYYETESSETVNYNNFNYYYQENNKRFYFRNPSKEGVNLSKVALKQYLIKLSEKYNVYLLLDNPMDSSFDPRKFIGNRLVVSTADSVSKSVLLSKTQLALNFELKALTNETKVQVIDQLGYLCPNNMCIRLDDNGSPIYNDDSHLRPGFVKNKIFLFDFIK
jgi:peptidoglycan/LPS O-acetylase OafA/YrhL